MLPAGHSRALDQILAILGSLDLAWALTGSTSFVLQGVGVSPHDIDIQTDEEAAAPARKWCHALAHSKVWIRLSLPERLTADALFRDFDILELIAKPRVRVKTLPEYESPLWRGDLSKYYL